MLDDGQINRWFQREVLPLERLLQMYIKRHWSKLEDIVEIRQDVYEKILIGVVTFAGSPAVIAMVRVEPKSRSWMTPV